MLYRAGQAVLAPGGRRDVAETLGPLLRGAGGLVLEVGCGPRSWLDDGRRAVGVDVDADVVAAHQRRGGLGVVGRAEALPLRSGAFPTACAAGLLHHLRDDQARAALCELQRVTGSGGQAVIFDGVRAGPRASAWARLVRRLDRGRCMRSAGAFEQLVGSTGPWVTDRVRYGRPGLEGVVAHWERTS